MRFSTMIFFVLIKKGGRNERKNQAVSVPVSEEKNLTLSHKEKMCYGKFCSAAYPVSVIGAAKDRKDTPAIS